METKTEVMARSDGRQWAVRIVFKGGRYGLDDCLTNNDEDPLIEFYDHGNEGVFGPDGQFVSSYGLSMLDGSHEYSRAQNWEKSKLVLDGGIPNWWVDGSMVLKAIALAK